jgi:hypothetical protein
MENLRVHACLAGIDWIAFPITTAHGPHLTPVRHDHLVPEFPQQFTGPERRRAGFSREARGRERPEASRKGRAGTPYPAFLPSHPHSI